MKSNYIWMNGELVPFEQATVHFLSPTLHYGFGAFEGARCYDTPNGPAAFRLYEHLERFVNSALILGIQDFPYSVEELRDAVHETIRVIQHGEVPGVLKIGDMRLLGEIEDHIFLVRVDDNVFRPVNAHYRHPDGVDQLGEVRVAQ